MKKSNAPAMKDFFICSPEHFNSVAMQTYVKHKIRERDKQWIYDLIKHAEDDDVLLRNNETIYINTADWMFCRDVHPGRDVRYLVVFKDRRLLTIRNLDASHLETLVDIQTQVTAFLRIHHRDSYQDYAFFFHYMPSVYQLHAHVSAHTMPAHVARRHHFRHIIGNIRKTPQHYARALILTSRALRSSDWK